jgi:hypothetical protein
MSAFLATAAIGSALNVIAQLFIQCITSLQGAMLGLVV